VKKKKSPTDISGSRKDKGRESNSRSSATGFKRKRDAEDDDTEPKLRSTVATPQGTEANDGHGGHKRKRRRKSNNNSSEVG
jgi:hypothetical protein